MARNRITIASNRPGDMVEVRPPSGGSVDMDGLSVEQCPPRPLPIEER